MAITVVRSIYSDVDRSLGRAPSGDLKIVKDVEAVEQCIDAILNTRKGSRKFKASLGTNLENFLFEPMTTEAEIVIENELTKAVREGDGRIQLKSVQVDGNRDEHTYRISVYGVVDGLTEFYYSRIISAE